MRDTRCPTCGSAVETPSQMPTVAVPQTPHTGRSSTFHSQPIGRIDASGPSVHAAFTPGEVLAGRYRIIGLLGRGGMGEVYRADDLELGQAVSLKFLPRSLADSPGALERFRAEVRNARQVSHPNVCRVYDIGEVGGVHFLSMEFVDGEDLGSLLRRIGRLPKDKANELAGQMCAGLAAAHDKSLLHRDLKPSNVMIDGDGHVRITDFGLAVRADEGIAEFAGTPAYMAPEQFEGQPATVRSDLYSLGLVLYEMYTGKRPFDATSVAEWKSRHTQSEPTLPSMREPDVDEVVERSILRCLEKDPSRRPASARQLAAALPGGDPLAAALAAGETPSPGMVAASGGEGALALRTAGLMVLGIVAGAIAVLAIAPFSEDLGLARMTKGPEALRDRGSDLLERFGYGHEMLDRASWFERDYAPLLYMAKTKTSTEWRAQWHRWQAPVTLFLRQSPQWMTPIGVGGNVSRDDPPYEVSGMTQIAVSAEGQLRYLRAVPPQIDTLPAAPAFAWSEMFAAAGFDTARFHAVTPRWLPPEVFDARAEWTGTHATFPDLPLTIAAASFRGRPVYFEIFGPWSKPNRMVRPSGTLSQRVAGYTLGFLSAILVFLALFLTRRNQRLGRSDTKGAYKVGGFLFGAFVLGWIVSAHHVPRIDLEAGSFALACSGALLLAAMAGVLYLAVEPYVRRRMPELMVGWARLLEGRLRDPWIGRDVLSGALLGIASAFLLHASNALPTWVPILGQTTVPPSTQLLDGGGRMVGWLLQIGVAALLRALSLFFLLFIFRVVLKREKLAVIAGMVVLTLMNLGGENFALETPFAILQGVITGWALGRVGLLGVAVMLFYRIVFSALPLPIETTAPYAATSAVVLVTMLAVVAFAFRNSVGSRPLMSVSALEP